MFEKWKRSKGIDVYALVDGTIKPMQEVEDPMFAQSLIGQGVAIVPNGDILCAPLSGVLSVVFPTGHAFGITSEDGLEFLIHVGVNTVNLKGEGFSVLAKQGQKIKMGDPLVSVDWELIKAKGYPVDTMMLVTTPSEHCRVTKMIPDHTPIHELESILFHCEKR